MQPVDAAGGIAFTSTWSLLHQSCSRFIRFATPNHDLFSQTGIHELEGLVYSLMIISVESASRLIFGEVTVNQM